jgi:hypothetical protein
MKNKTPTFVVILIGAVVIFWAIRAKGDEIGRTVENGDYIYTATAQGASSDEAQFRARMAAVRNLMNDCGVAHKNTAFGKGIVGQDGSSRSATATAYIDISDCLTAKDAKDKAPLENASLVADEAIYTKMLMPEVQPSLPPAVVTEPESDNQPEVAVVENKIQPPTPVTIVWAVSGKQDCWRERQAMIAREEGLSVGSPDQIGAINQISLKNAECRAGL